MEEGEEESHFQTFLLHHIHQIQQHQLQQPPLLAASPKKQKTAAATRQIVPVPGGHIVRSTGQKDRHSKVCTAKGLRDRRVRLSAHTAIEFYDVQDRLGYDRPSMAVDWLIKNSKNAIDELDHLPPWQPTAMSSVGFQEIADPITNSGSIYPFPPDPLSRTRSHAQDLRLSLQSFQESNNNNMFSFDASSAMTDTGGGSGYLDRQFFTQRGPLQSSTPPSVPPWMDPIHSPTPFHHPSSSLSVPDIDFGSGSGGGFSGFRIPSWIHDNEEHNKPGSNSHH